MVHWVRTLINTYIFIFVFGCLLKPSLVLFKSLRSRGHMGGEGNVTALGRHIIYTWAIALLLTLTLFSSARAQEPLAATLQFEILTPGTTKTMVMSQDNNFPQDFSQFIVFVIGTGPVSLTLSKHKPVGDLVRLTGVGISSEGIIPFIKFGSASITFNVGIQIGNERSPYGLLLFSSWIDEPSGGIDEVTGENSNTYTITLSF